MELDDIDGPWVNVGEARALNSLETSQWESRTFETSGMGHPVFFYSSCRGSPHIFTDSGQVWGIGCLTEQEKVEKDGKRILKV